LPILPGVHWSDDLPLLVPEGEQTNDVPKTRQAGRVKTKPPTKLMPPTKSAMIFGKPGAMPVPTTTEATQTKVAQTKAIEKPIKPAKMRKAPTELANKARELRDKYLEQVNTMPITSSGKYDVVRRIEKAETIEAKRLAA
jgi:hypothetical protein